MRRAGTDKRQKNSRKGRRAPPGKVGSFCLQGMFRCVQGGPALQAQLVLPGLGGQVAACGSAGGHEIVVQLFRPVGIGGQLPPEIRLHGGGSGRILAGVQGSAAAGEGRIAPGEILVPALVDGDGFLLAGDALRRKVGQHVAHFGKFHRQGRLHHPGVFFKHQVAPQGLGVLQVPGVAFQQRVGPGQKLAFAHQVEGVALLLAGGWAAQVVDAAQHGVFDADDLLDQIAAVVHGDIPAGPADLPHLLSCGFFAAGSEKRRGGPSGNGTAPADLPRRGGRFISCRRMRRRRERRARRPGGPWDRDCPKRSWRRRRGRPGPAAPRG